MLSRVIIGSTTSIYATLLLVAVITVVGTAIGIFCGWKGGKADTVLMRISDLFLAFPGLVFALAVAGVLGGGIQNAYCSGGDQLAEVCKTCQRAYPDSEGLCISYGGKAFREQYRKASAQTLPSKYCRPHTCYVSS